MWTPSCTRPSTRWPVPAGSWLFINFLLFISSPLVRAGEELTQTYYFDRMIPSSTSKWNLSNCSRLRGRGRLAKQIPCLAAPLREAGRPVDPRKSEQLLCCKFGRVRIASRRMIGGNEVAMLLRSPAMTTWMCVRKVGRTSPSATRVNVPRAHRSLLPTVYPLLWPADAPNCRPKRLVISALAIVTPRHI